VKSRACDSLLASVQLAGGKNTAHVDKAIFRLDARATLKAMSRKIGGGAAAGASLRIGPGGGGECALIGTAVGAGAGTGVAAATGKEEAVIHCRECTNLRNHGECYAR
jgi:hypothetical protein